MTRSSFAIAYTIYYVYVYINVCSRGIRAPHESRLLPRPFLANYYIGLMFSFDAKSGVTLLQWWIIAKERVKPKEETNGKGDECANVNVARDAQSQLALFFLSSRELYNLRYVTSPSKIHFTIHTNIYNRYINNIADNNAETAPDIRLNWIVPIE